MWAKELTGSNGVAGSVFAALGAAEPARTAGRRADRPVQAPHRDDRRSTSRPLPWCCCSCWSTAAATCGCSTSWRSSTAPRWSRSAVARSALLTHDARGPTSSGRRTARCAPCARRCGWSPRRRRRPVRLVRRAGASPSSTPPPSSSRPPPCSRMRVDEPEPVRSDLHFLAEASAGGRHLLGRRRCCGPPSSPPSSACSPSASASRCSSRSSTRAWASRWSSSACCGAIQGVGAILAGVTITALIRRTGELRPVALGVRRDRAWGSLLSTSSQLPVVAAGTLLFGAGLPVLIVCLTTVIQRRTPGELQGRTFTAFELFTGVPQLLSILGGAVAVSLVDYRIPLVAMAVGIAAAAVYSALRLREDLRRLDGRTQQLGTRPSSTWSVPVGAHVLQQPTVVADEQQRPVVASIAPPRAARSRRGRGGWSARRARGRWPAGHQQRQVGPGALARRQASRPGAARRRRRARTSRAGCARRASSWPVAARNASHQACRPASNGPAHLVDLADHHAAARARTGRTPAAADRAARPAGSILPEPFGPMTATRSPRRRRGRPGRAGSRRGRRPPSASPATTSAPRGAGSRARRSSHGSRGSSTGVEPVQLPHQSAGRRRCATAARPSWRRGCSCPARRPGPSRWSPGPGPAGPLLLPAGPVDQRVALRVVALVGRPRGAPGRARAPRGRPRSRRRTPCAAAELVDLEHARSPPARGRRGRARRRPAHRRGPSRNDSSSASPSSVEVVGRLVEQQDVVLAEQHGGQAGPGQLAAGEGGGRAVESGLGQPEPGDHRGRAAVEVGAAEGEPALQRHGVRSSAPSSRPPARLRPRAARRPRRRRRYAGPGTAAASPRSAGRAPAAAARPSRRRARA